MSTFNKSAIEQTKTISIVASNLMDSTSIALPKKSTIAARLPLRRGLDESEAAVYLSLSPSFFRKLVENRTMPRPRVAGSRRIWDVDELDLAFKALPREDGGSDVAFVEGRTDSWADFE